MWYEVVFCICASLAFLALVIKNIFPEMRRRERGVDDLAEIRDMLWNIHQIMIERDARENIRVLYQGKYVRAGELIEVDKAGGVDWSRSYLKMGADGLELCLARKNFDK